MRGVGRAGVTAKGQQSYRCQAYECSNVIGEDGLGQHDRCRMRSPHLKRFTWTNGRLPLTLLLSKIFFPYPQASLPSPQYDVPPTFRLPCLLTSTDRIGFLSLYRSPTTPLHKDGRSPPTNPLHPLPRRLRCRLLLRHPLLLLLPTPNLHRLLQLLQLLNTGPSPQLPFRSGRYCCNDVPPTEPERYRMGSCE